MAELAAGLAAREHVSELAVDILVRRVEAMAATAAAAAYAATSTQTRASVATVAAVARTWAHCAAWSIHVSALRAPLSAADIDGNSCTAIRSAQSRSLDCSQSSDTGRSV